MIKHVEIYSACASEDGNYIKILIDTDFYAISNRLKQISDNYTVYSSVHLFQKVQGMPVDSVLLFNHLELVKLVLRGFERSQSDYIFSCLEHLLGTSLRDVASKSRIGCQIKSSLKHVVYNSLDKIWANEPYQNQLQGEDCYVVPIDDNGIQCINSLISEEISPRTVQKLVKNINNSNRFVSPLICLDQTISLLKKQTSFESIMSALHSTGITVGKGHTIEIPFSTFCNIDTVTISKPTESKTFLLDSVDLISQIIPDIRGSVEIAINNALKDVIAKGAHTIAYVIPKGSAISSDNMDALNNAIQQYVKRLHPKKSYEVDHLPCHESLIGAHVGAFCNNPILASDAQVGDVVAVSRPLGALFAVSTPDHFSSGDYPHIYENAISWLQKCDIPLARILASHSRHIHAAKDISGEGLQWHLQEMAALSGVEITVERVPLLFGSKLKNVRVLTQETNGPVIFCLSKEHFEDIASEMEQKGYFPQIVGRVKGKNTEGRVNFAEKCSYVDCSRDS